MSKPNRLHSALAALALFAVLAVSGATVAHYKVGFLDDGMTVYSGVQAATTTAGGGASSSSQNSNGNGNGHNTFTISGSHVTGLYPGAGYPVGSTSNPVYVYLTVTNPNNQAIRVTSLTYTVGDASSSCTKGNLAPTSETVSFSVVVAKNLSVGGTTFPMPVAMSPAAVDACQDASFPLTLSGVAVGPA